MTDNIAVDLTTILAEERFRVVRVTSDSPARMLERRRSGPVLFSPRVWGDLSPESRANPHAFEVRYVS